jgi:hypothetical protein
MMFEFKYIKITKKTITKTVNGEVVQEQTVLNDGGLGQEAAEKKLDELKELFDMDKIMSGETSIDEIFNRLNKIRG